MSHFLVTSFIITECKWNVFNISDEAKFKKPKFKFKNVLSGKYLTSHKGSLLQTPKTDNKNQQW